MSQTSQPAEGNSAEFAQPVAVPKAQPVTGPDQIGKASLKSPAKNSLKVDSPQKKVTASLASKETKARRTATANGTSGKPVAGSLKGTRLGLATKVPKAKAIKTGAAKEAAPKTASSKAGEVKAAAAKKMATKKLPAKTGSNKIKVAADSCSKPVSAKVTASKAALAKIGASSTGRAADLANDHATRGHISGQALAELVAQAAQEHKVVAPVILNLTGLSSVADWFYIASAENSRQVKAVAEKIVRRVREAGVRPLGQEGVSGSDSRWALLDLGDVVAHIFMPDARSLYDLESLWADAPRLSSPEPERVPHLS
ncbi:MAG: ribosome silencing factor [Deltaproteobacteria bacterium]|nr:ribosome silencing factor [Deltaproteobacteria bacterium]